MTRVKLVNQATIHRLRNEGGSRNEDCLITPWFIYLEAEFRIALRIVFGIVNFISQRRSRKQSPMETRKIWFT